MRLSLRACRARETGFDALGMMVWWATVSQEASWPTFRWRSIFSDLQLSRLSKEEMGIRGLKR